MATAQVLLLNSVNNLGSEGDTVKVKAGYARNRLFPLKLAIPVTSSNKKQVEALKARRLERETKERSEAEGLAEKLKSLSIAISVKTGSKGKLFGAVTADDVSERLAKEGVKLSRKQLALSKPVKDLGKHTVHMKLHPEVTLDFDFEVVSENPIEDSEEA